MTNENHICPICGGELVSEALMNEKKDACYYKVKSRYKVWPSAYACVPVETSKALTRNGWKSVDELTIGDEIMTFNMEKDVLEFKPILNLHRYESVQTTVVKSGNTGFIFECTPNHKWVVKFPEQKSDKSGKYTKINDMSLVETADILNAKNNKHLVVTAQYDGGTLLKKNKIFKYGDNWVKYILDITQEQRQSWLFSAIVYDGNQIKTQRLLEKNKNLDELDWKYSGNHGKQAFGFKQKDIEHRNAFLLAAFLNGGTVTWKKNNKRDIYSCYYVSDKRYKNLSNFKSIKTNVTNVWCPETENNTWVMMQETDGNGIITVTGNSGALVKCRKKGAKNWGTKSEGFEEVDEACWKGYHKEGNKKMFGKTYPNCVKNTNEATEELDEKWSNKYKRSIDCSHPKGFSQRAHCQGRKKTEEEIMKEEQLRKIIKEMIEQVMNESRAQDPDKDELVNFFKGKQGLYGSWTEIEPDAEAAIYWFAHDYHGGQASNLYSVLSTSPYRPGRMMSSAENEGDSVKMMYDDLVSEFGGGSSEVDECWECYAGAMEEGTNEAWEECYKKANWGMIPEGDEHTCEGDEFYECYGDFNADAPLEEAEYHGRKVPLGKPMRGDVKKFKVFVKNPTTGKVKKVNFGDKKMRIKKSNPKRRKSFRARHNCANPGPRTKARYWSCRAW